MIITGWLVKLTDIGLKRLKPKTERKKNKRIEFAAGLSSTAILQGRRRSKERDRRFCSDTERGDTDADYEGNCYDFFCLDPLKRFISV